MIKKWTYTSAALHVFNLRGDCEGMLCFRRLLLWAPALFLLLEQEPRSFFCEAFVIEPGVGLTSVVTGGAVEERVLIFEHTPRGTGGLVLNQPTPIRLKDLNIPKFRAFADNSIVLGCGTSTTTATSNNNNNVPLSDMAPWFWIHSVPDLPGSSLLPGAAGPLFMGGNLDQAAERIASHEIQPQQFKFFWKYKQWPEDELLREIEAGQWICQPQDPDQALEPCSLPVFL